MTEQSVGTESQPLLVALPQRSSPLPQQQSTKSCWSRHLCLSSKAAILVLLWTVMEGAAYLIVTYMSLWLLFLGVFNTNISLLFILYLLMATVYFVYPINGFLADVCCGRFKTVILCLCFMTFSLIAVLLLMVILRYFQFGGLYNLFYVIGLIGLLVFAVSSTGYRANYIQFGLDQLLEAPSQHQALFVHWAVWSSNMLSGLFVALGAFIDCGESNLKDVVNALVPVIGGCSSLLLMLLIFNFWKRHWFYTESRLHNPYKMVFKVLRFTWKHKYPLQRSAFTYCDDERPSRLDFAKERFGGPFTTEQVEDVKTFLRIIVMFMSLGPVFVMDIPASVVALPLLGLHATSTDAKEQCQLEWIFLHSGFARYTISTLFVPIYMWIIFKFRKQVPRIFTRLKIGILSYFAGVLSILCVDLSGHLLIGSNSTNCMFNITVNQGDLFFPSLDMHWSVLLPPNILIGIGQTLVTATVFEYISAQSPHSMKGLLLGVYYATVGVFQVISGIVLIPFIETDLHLKQPTRKQPYFISCVTDYLLFTCIVSLIGLVLFSIMAKRYKFRERDDRPYDQRFVIDVYDRYLSGAVN